MAMPDPAAPAPATGGLARRLWLVAGWGLIVVGFPVFVLPIPLGAAMMLAGAMILARNSPSARVFMRQTYRRFPRSLQPLRTLAKRWRRQQDGHKDQERGP